MPLPTLPRAAVPPDVDGLLFDVAWLDSSGRMSTRSLVRALGWRAGRRLDVAAIAGRVVVTVSTTGLYAVTARGEVSVPAAARALSGIGLDERVLLIADLTRGVLMVHAAASVIRLLHDSDADLPGGDDAH